MLSRLNAGYQPTLPRTAVYDKVMRFASGGEVVAPDIAPIDMIRERRREIDALRRSNAPAAQAEVARLEQEIKDIMTATIERARARSVPPAPEITVQDRPPQRPRSRPEDYVPRAPEITGKGGFTQYGADPALGTMVPMPPEAPRLPVRPDDVEPSAAADRQTPGMLRARDDREQAFDDMLRQRMNEPSQRRAPESEFGRFEPGEPGGFDSGISALGRGRVKQQVAEGERGILGGVIDRIAETAPGQPGAAAFADRAFGRTPADTRPLPSDFEITDPNRGADAATDFDAVPGGPVLQRPPRSAGAPGSAAPAPSAPARRPAGAAPAGSGAPADTPPLPTPRGGITSLAEDPVLPGSGGADPVSGPAAGPGDPKAQAQSDRPWFDLTDEQAQFLMDLGFGMLASDSPFFGTALGQGGQLAVKGMREGRQRKYEQERNTRLDALEEKYKTGVLGQGDRRLDLADREIQMQADQFGQKLAQGADELQMRERIARMQEGGAWARARLGAGASIASAEIANDANRYRATLAAGEKIAERQAEAFGKVGAAIDTVFNTATSKTGKPLEGAYELPEDARREVTNYALGLIQQNPGMTAEQAAMQALSDQVAIMEKGGWFGKDAYKLNPNPPRRPTAGGKPDSANIRQYIK